MSEFWAALKDKMVAEIKIGNIGDEIRKAIVPNVLFHIDIAGYDLQISDAIVATWVVMAVIFALGWIFGRKPQRIPTTKRQLVAESLINLLLNLCQSSNMTYDQAEVVVPFVGTIAVFISLTNLSSMFKIPPPAKNPAFPIALALFTIMYVIATSIRFVGLKGFWASLTYPKAMLLPFKILDYVIKPMSLSLRLFGNVFGAFILMEFVYLIVPIILPGVVGLWFDLADGILQGIIFTYLSVTYVGEVLEAATESQHAKQAQLAAHS
ncbi:MAG: FoF1 ATP synthase subunit a [Clostridiaceae bacterium]|nr:FoF1 ATP synthase subunit a [Clostridiaceae bacterium]